LHASSSHFSTFKISLKSLQYGLELADTVDISYTVRTDVSCANISLFMKVVQDFNKDKRKNGNKEVTINKVTTVRNLAGYSDTFNKMRKAPLPSGIIFDKNEITQKGVCYIVGDFTSMSEKIQKIFFNHPHDICRAAMTDISYTLHGQ
jgi:hypothetical protein